MQPHFLSAATLCRFHLSLDLLGLSATAALAQANVGVGTASPDA
jgi:hypothetical protein